MWIKVTTFHRPTYKALVWLTKYITVVATIPSMENRRCIISCEMSIKPQIMNILPSECHQVLFQLHKLLQSVPMHHGMKGLFTLSVIPQKLIMWHLFDSLTIIIPFFVLSSCIISNIWSDKNCRLGFSIVIHKNKISYLWLGGQCCAKKSL